MSNSKQKKSWKKVKKDMDEEINEEYPGSDREFWLNTDESYLYSRMYREDIGLE